MFDINIQLRRIQTWDNVSGFMRAFPTIFLPIFGTFSCPIFGAAQISPHALPAAADGAHAARQPPLHHPRSPVFRVR
jgi:hypothetical protein